LTVCDTLKACYLVNIQTRKEIELQSSNKLVLDPLNTEGYSIRCDVNGVNELHFIKFFYDGKVQDEYDLPRYMDGDSDKGAYINKVEYISTCGVKTVKIEGHVWDRECFENEYVIEVSNAGGKACDVKDPTAAPAKPTTAAPAKPETRAPTKPETRAPTKPETRAPTKPETRAPVPAPINKPVAPPVKPVPVPVPVRQPVPQPVAKPVPVPVTPTCPYPKVWINGCCKEPPATPTCPYPKVWINGCCKDPTPVCTYPKTLINGVCKDPSTTNYICPANSCRIAHRSFYVSFDDCQCNYGYYKSKFENKCLRYSWCLW
jgi:hypothetical protein